MCGWIIQQCSRCESVAAPSRICPHILTGVALVRACSLCIHGVVVCVAQIHYACVLCMCVYVCRCGGSPGPMCVLSHHCADPMSFQAL
jgi:hypothetical protein